MLRKWSAVVVGLLGIGCLTPADAVFPPKWGKDQVFVLPEAGRYPFLAMIANADKTLDIAAYRLADPEIVRALKGASQRGVRVRVLLEPNPQGRNKAEIGRDILALKEAGVQIYTPSKRFNQSYYKMIIADGKMGLISTGNLRKEIFDGSANDRPARDFAVPVSEAARVREMSRIFTADIQDRRVVPKDTPLIWGPEQTRTAHLNLINGATKSIWIYNQNIQDNGIVRALAGAARAGVKVKILMSSNPFHDAPKDLNVPKQRRLVGAGAEVRLLNDPYIHAKAMIVDGKTVSVGSANFWHTSLDGTRDLNIVTSEPKQVTTIRKTFEDDWSKAKDFEGSRTSKEEILTHTPGVR